MTSQASYRLEQAIIAEEREPRPDMVVYLDLDGVFADYDAGIRRLGFNPDPALAKELNRSGSHNPLKREMYEAIRGTDFYAHLPILPGALDIYRCVASLQPIILTAAPKFGATEDDFHVNPHWLGAAYHKRRWVEETLLPQALPRFDMAWGMHRTHHPDRIPIEDERFICTTSARKQQFIHRRHGPTQILVDDRIANCRAWAAAGGEAIYHIDPDNTVALLKELRRMAAWTERTFSPRVYNEEHA